MVKLGHFIYFNNFLSYYSPYQKKFGWGKSHGKKYLGLAHAGIQLHVLAGLLLLVEGLGGRRDSGGCLWRRRLRLWGLFEATAPKCHRCPVSFTSLIV